MSSPFPDASGLITTVKAQNSSTFFFPIFYFIIPTTFFLLEMSIFLILCTLCEVMASTWNVLSKFL